MAAGYDVAVIGAGMIGACAAWRIASRGLSVALIGPGEPADRATHQGVFASHYDQGRITRILDGDLVWGRLALASIEHYGVLEEEGGIAFYTEAGCLRLGMGDTRLAAADRNGHELGADHRRLDTAGLRAAFPYLAVPDGAVGLAEHRRAGHVNPRALVAAARAAAARRGGTVIEQEVQRVDVRAGGASVMLAGGEVVDAGRVLVATGAFASMPGIVPRKLSLVVEPRTVVLFECDRDRRAALDGLPSLITSVDGEGGEIDLYAVPPVAYPDGRVWFKAGSGVLSEPLHITDGADAVKAWFRGGGRDREIAYIRRAVESLLPALRGVPTTTAQCVVTQTPSGYPHVGMVDGGLVGVAIGGNGYAAKSCLEIGRIAADMVIDGAIEDAALAGDFAPHFVD